MCEIKEVKSGASEDFHESDKYGNLGEKYAISFIVKVFGYKFLHQTEGYNPDYDLKFFTPSKNLFDNVEIVNSFMYNNKCRFIEMNKTFFKTVEVKTDMYDYTNLDNGNISFEVIQHPNYASYSKPSGLEVTKADIWFNFHPGLKEVWIIEVKKLKKLIIDLEEDNKAFFVDDCASKSNPTGNWLIGRKIAFPYFKVFNSKKPFNKKAETSELTFKHRNNV